jgi:phosphoglucomutase
MGVHNLAGKPAPKEMLVDVQALVDAYYSLHPDMNVASHRVSFGTSGHRGSSFSYSFNEDHILSITQAICDYKKETGIDGPLFMGKDTHALSEPAFRTALEVLAANAVTVMIQEDGGFTLHPAPRNCKSSFPCAIRGFRLTLISVIIREL